MSQLRIITNRVPRDILSWHDLTAKEQAEFDYLDSEESQCDATFFRYRGNVYDLNEFMSVDRNAPEPLRAWHGYHSDSYFSGIVVRFVDHDERVIAGLYLS